MNYLSILATILESLGEAAENTGTWLSVRDALQYFGSRLGWTSETLNALEESSNLIQFVGNLTANIEGGEAGATAAAFIATSFFEFDVLGASVGLVALASPETALYVAAAIAGLPEIFTIAALGGFIAGGALLGSEEAQNLFNQAYNYLVSGLNNAPAPSTWTEIGTDSSGNSLLLDAVFSNAIGAALGLGNDSTMLVDIASSATESSSSPLYNGDVAANSLLTDANLLGTLVAANEIGGAQPLTGPANPLAGTAVTEALAEIAVQYAGDQAGWTGADLSDALLTNDNRRALTQRAA